MAKNVTKKPVARRNRKNILSHVIGFTGIDNQGLSGLELKYDKLLTGKNGNIKYYSDGKGKRLSMPEVYESPTDGKDIKLTVDLDVQLSLENELHSAYKKKLIKNGLIQAIFILKII